MVERPNPLPDRPVHLLIETDLGKTSQEVTDARGGTVRRVGVRLRKVLSSGHVTFRRRYYLLARLLGVVLQLAIGLWLFLGTETLTGWLRKTRQAR